MNDMKAKVHGRPEGAAGELYDKLVASKACNHLRDAMTVLCSVIDDTHGIIGASTVEGKDLVVVQFHKFQGEEVFVQHALEIEKLDVAVKDLDGEELVVELAAMLSSILKANGYNVLTRDEDGKA